MRKIHTIIILVALTACSLGASGQETSRSAYFLDGYSFRHELNPAFIGERNYISIPALGNINASLGANIGVNKFLFKTPAGSPYKLTTFMSPTVDAGDFLGKLKNDNIFTTNVDYTILSAGFQGFKGYNTVSIGAHVDAGLNLPKPLFEFMKVMQAGPDTEYTIDDLRVKANAYAEIALGHSHKINEKLTVGAKAKLLLGGANVDGHITDMKVKMSNDQWLVNATGNVNMAAGEGLYVPTKLEAKGPQENPKMNDLIEWGKIDYNNFHFSGYGFGVDLGATYRLLPDLQLSMSVNDLGFISWKDGVRGRTGNADGSPWTFDGFKDITVTSDQEGYHDNKLSKQLDNMWDDLQQVINVHREDGVYKYTRALAANLHLGAEYNMPFYRNLTAAALITSHIDGCFSWTEGRIYANVKPVNWFDATVNYGASKFGQGFGWMLNFHPRGFNFFVGSDYQMFKITPQGVPVGNANANVNVGFNITFNSPKPVCKKSNKQSEFQTTTVVVEGVEKVVETTVTTSANMTKTTTVIKKTKK